MKQNNYCYKDTEISIDFVDYFKMHILTIENKRITECAFVYENSEYDEVSIPYKKIKFLELLLTT